MSTTLLNILFYITFFAFSFGQLGRISFLRQEINGYWYEIPLLLSIIFLILQYGIEPIKESFKRFAMVYIFAIYLTATTLFSLPWFSETDNYVALLYLARVALYFMYFVYAGYHLREEPPIKKLFINGYWNILIINILAGVLQYFVFPDLSKLYYEGWDPHLYRLFGLYFDPVVAGAAYGLLLLFTLLSSYKMSKHLIIRIAVIAVLLIFMLFTFSRGTYIAIVLTLGILALRSKALYVLMGFAAIFTLALFLLPKPVGEGVNLLRSSTIDSRIVDYQEGISIWKKNPIIGIGYNHIRAVKKNAKNMSPTTVNVSHAGSAFHSSFITILVTGGLVGFVLFVMALVELAQLGQYSFYVVLFLSIISLFDNILLHPFILFLFLSTTTLHMFNPSDIQPLDS